MKNYKIITLSNSNLTSLNETMAQMTRNFMSTGYIPPGGISIAISTHRLMDYYTFSQTITKED